ncbi:hypothetical protein, partial [Escherichia coli]|uniref:hypothetical protein n=1 Tax=Escherichia coli TaxID=562 RepID=UPI001954AC7F
FFVKRHKGVNSWGAVVLALVLLAGVITWLAPKPSAGADRVTMLSHTVISRPVVEGGLGGASSPSTSNMLALAQGIVQEALE